MSMTPRERMEAFYRGERPDRCPLTIYHFFLNGCSEAEQQRLFDLGLSPTTGVPPYGVEQPDGLEVVTDEYEENGEHIRRVTRKTPVGEIFQTHANGWHRDYLLKTGEDYKVMAWIFENQKTVPTIEQFRRTVDAMPDHVIPWIMLGRTPIQNIIVDFAGLENFAYHLADFEDEVMLLYDAMRPAFRRKAEICADAPGTFVSNLENFTAETLGPARYEELILPVYEECFGVIHEAGKVIGSHYDGKTRSCADAVASAPNDIIESFTEPPEGDMPYHEARAAWPEKRFWCCIRVSDYTLPPEKLRERVLDMWERGTDENHAKLAFEVSEDMPANWAESIPVVLEALAETEA